MTRFAFTLTRSLIVLPGIGVAVGVALIAALVVMRTPEAAAAVVAVSLPLAAPATAGGCAGCGFVRTIRRTDPATGLPAYAFTVRMRDGSTRDSSHASRGAWREGDGVMVIGGVAARALEVQRNAPL